jgi:hypothetical protein
MCWLLGFANLPVWSSQSFTSTSCKYPLGSWFSDATSPTHNGQRIVYGGRRDTKMRWMNSPVQEWLQASIYPILGCPSFGFHLLLSKVCWRSALYIFNRWWSPGVSSSNKDSGETRRFVSCLFWLGWWTEREKTRSAKYLQYRRWCEQTASNKWRPCTYVRRDCVCHARPQHIPRRHGPKVAMAEPADRTRRRR